ncbi:MAG: nucleotidyltransferase family protein [Blastocatellales bacterium]
MISDEIRQLIESAAQSLKAAGAREVYLFGSAASGQMREDSDIDLAVSGLPPELFYRAGAAAEDALGRPLDLIDLDEVTPFTKYLKEESELLRVG